MTPALQAALLKTRKPTKTLLTRLYDNTTLATFTFSDAALGTPRHDRRIIANVWGISGSNNRTLDVVTIGGIPATIHLSVNNSSRRYGIVSAWVPGGFTGDIVVTFSGTEATCLIDPWAVYNLRSDVPIAAAVSSIAAPLALDIACPQDGLIFGGGFSAANTSATWVGLAEETDANPGDGRTYSSASLVADADKAPLTISCTWASSTQPVGGAIAFR